MFYFYASIKEQEIAIILMKISTCPSSQGQKEFSVDRQNQSCLLLVTGGASLAAEGEGRALVSTLQGLGAFHGALEMRVWNDESEFRVLHTKISHYCGGRMPQAEGQSTR